MVSGMVSGTARCRPRWLAASRSLMPGARPWHGLLTVVVVSALGATVGTRLGAQQPAVRDSAPPDLRVVRGQVKSDDDSATLLRRARITVISTTMSSVFTDQEGRFEVAVPAKSYAIRISKPGFAPQQLQGPDGANFGPHDIRLARGAAINGRVIDNAGAPVVDARVTVRAVGETVRGRVPVNVVIRTDDHGEFRVGSLPQGRYAVVVDASAGRGVIVDAAMASAPDAAPNPSRSAGGGAASVEAPPTAVQVRTAEETSVTVVLDSRTDDYRDATSYVAGYEAAQAQGARDALFSVLRPGPRTFVSRGTAQLAGRITDPYGRGVAGAIVRLAPASSGLARVAASDIGGRYQFTGVAAGSYRISAAKRALLGAEHGQERAGQPGRIITLRDRQRLDRVDIGLMRGASISGIVTDPDGEPMEGLAMHAWRLEYRNGRPVNEAAGVVVRTDDRGRYRLHGLAAGTYYVVAADDPTASESMAAVTRAPRAFYPGTPTVALATPMRVDVGIDAAGIDMAFAPPGTVRVTGRAWDTAGNPLNRPVVLVGSTRSGFPAPAAQMAAMSGLSFEFPHVLPGEYVIQAMQYWGDFPELNLPPEFTAQALTVGDEGVAGLTLATGVGSTVTGRIVAEKGGRPQVTGPWLRVMAADPDYEPASVLPRPWATVINPDFTFRLTGMVGPLRLTSTAELPSNVWLKTANMGGINVAEQPAAFGRRDESNTYIEIVLANDGAEVSGRVVDGRKEAAASYVVAVFPTAREHWYNGSRYIRLARPDEQAQFRAGMLPPGEYWMAAVDALEDTAIEDPEVLQQLMDVGRRVTLSAGQKMMTELSLARLTR